MPCIFDLCRFRSHLLFHLKYFFGAMQVTPKLCLLAEKMKCGSKRKKANWAWPGIEPGTSRNSENIPKRESCH
ncbi:hypothetical protein RclHR1_02660021 [Rhizophagus clarus]|uniref:Uncharacterized protein n=1 Tax=Rhizophagus clarus TaxID=94130 RepID=A0A2Z6R1A5_9GLOM|nr:hypothetical protein RclHR1_02660021 [Rhizophagus clarus]GES77667.1 hypothetical protein RCL_e11622_RclHR1_02660021 [Rhizophagus clarus]